MATAAAAVVDVACEPTDKTMVSELKKKNESLEMEVERLTNLCKKSERKRRKQKVVYEKNMENLSIRLTDFETNLRREQKEIQELIATKDNQIKVRDDLVQSLRDQLEQLRCSKQGITSDVVIKQQQLEGNTTITDDDDEKVKDDESVRQLPQLDLPPPEEKPNISFTDHRPFRPKSKLLPVAEESELSFGSSLRGIHADLTPDRFHAALTASLSLLNEDEEEEVEEVDLSVNNSAGETPANSVDDLTEDKACCSSVSDLSSTQTETDLNLQSAILENANLKDENCTSEPTLFQVAKKSSVEPINGKRVAVSDSLSSFCDRLLSDALKFANENIMFKPKLADTPSSTPPQQTCSARRCVETFSSDLIQQSFSAALSELTFSMINSKDTNTSVEQTAKSSSREVSHFEEQENNRNTKLHTAAAKVADSFFSNNFIVKSLHQDIKQQQQEQQQQQPDELNEKHRMVVTENYTSTIEIGINLTGKSSFSEAQSTSDKFSNDDANLTEKSTIDTQPSSSSGISLKDEGNVDVESCMVPTTATRQDSSDAFVVIDEDEMLLNHTPKLTTTIMADQTQTVTPSIENESMMLVNNENAQSTLSNTTETRNKTMTPTSNNNSPEASKSSSSSSSKKKKKKKKKRSRKSVSEDSTTDIHDEDDDVKEDENIDRGDPQDVTPKTTTTTTTTDNLLPKQSSLDEKQVEETQTTRM